MAGVSGGAVGFAEQKWVFGLLVSKSWWLKNGG